MQTRVITHQDLQEVTEQARSLPRRRKNLNVHATLDAHVQRLFNAMEPGTYIRPHRHARGNGWELMLAIHGRFAILLFDDLGTVIDRFELSTASGPMAAEIPAQSWHTVVSLEPGTVMFEIKEGPYTPVEDKDFAGWAPEEAETRAQSFRAWFAAAKPGESPPRREPSQDDSPSQLSERL
jgi:cupin fold WbuC family metalloprotein